MSKLKLGKKKKNKPSLNTILEHNMILKFMLDYIFFCSYLDILTSF